MGVGKARIREIKMIKIFVQPFIFIMWESLAPQKKPFTDLYLKISFILIGLGGGQSVRPIVADGQIAWHVARLSTRSD